jgi:hypothetical protein
MACTKETVKSSGLNIWSSEAATGPTPVVESAKIPPSPLSQTPLTPVSIIAVQGLGSHEFYTWVKKVPSQNADKARRFRDKVQFWKGKKPQGKDGEDGPTEVMWVRDLLVLMFKDARIATYSYKSDWRDRTVKTSLRQCAEQFLNILAQHRQQADVSYERRQPIDPITKEYI